MRFEKNIAVTVLIMLLAVLSVVLPLLVFKNVFITFVLYYGVVSLCVPLFDLFVVRRMRWREAMDFLGFKQDKTSLLFGVFHGLGLFFIILIAYFSLRNLIDTSNVLLAVSSWGAESRLLVFALVILFNGFVEEFFWRGYCFGRLQGHYWKNLALVTVFYVSYHLATIVSFFGVSYISFALIASIALVGLLWGWMRIKFQNTWPSTLGHVLATVGYMTVFLLL